MAERVEITCQRLRVARDINQPCYWLLYECVEDSLLAACAWRVEHQPIEHHPRHLLRLGSIGLKERTRPDAECFSRQHFLYRLAMYSEAGPGELLDDLGGRIWLHEHMAAGSATADQHLWSCIGHLAECANNAVDLLVGDGAGC